MKPKYYALLLFTILGVYTFFFTTKIDTSTAASPLLLEIKLGQTDRNANLFPDLQSAIHYVTSLGNKYREIIITMHEGRYYLKNPIVIDIPALSTGEVQLTIQAAQGETVQLSGGLHAFTYGWGISPKNQRIVENTLQDVTVPFKTLNTDDGEERILSRHPNLPYFYKLEGSATTSLGLSPKEAFRFKEGIASSWEGSQAEVVTLQMYRAPRLTIQKIYPTDAEGFKTVAFTSKAEGSFDLSEFSPSLSKEGYRYRFYVENIPEIDSPGEWYFDIKTKKITYYLKNNESLENGAVVNKTTGKIVNFQIPNPIFNHTPLITIGNKNSFQRGLTMLGLQFVHTDWEFRGSYKGAQALSPSNVNDYFLSPAILMYCNLCRLEGNTISDIGGNALQIYGKSNLIKSNRISNIGGSGIILGDRFEKPATTRTGSNRIWDNVLSDIGYIHNEGVGIISYLSSNNTIAQNTLRNVAYSGISVGWDWSDKYTLINNSILNNRLENTMQNLNDGAPIYVVGNQRNSVIKGNYISGVSLNRHSVPDALFGLYLDRGSANFLVQDNFIGPSVNGNIKLSRGTNNTFDNNVLVADKNQTGPFFTIAQTFGTSTDKYGSGNIITRTIFYRAENLAASTPKPLWILEKGASVASSDFNLFYSKDNTPILLSQTWKQNFEKNSKFKSNPFFVYNDSPYTTGLIGENTTLENLTIRKVNYGITGARASSQR